MAATRPVRLVPLVALVALVETLVLLPTGRPVSSVEAPQARPETVRAQQLLLHSRSAGDGAANPLPPLQVSRVHIDPGAALRMASPSSGRYGYVLAGALTVYAKDTHAATMLATGRSALEDMSGWHEARNLTPLPVELLVIERIDPADGSASRAN